MTNPSNSEAAPQYGSELFMSMFASKADYDEALKIQQDTPIAWVWASTGVAISHREYLELANKESFQDQLIPAYARMPQEPIACMADGKLLSYKDSFVPNNCNLHLAAGAVGEPSAIRSLELAVIGRNHFGNPIPKEWYAAAKELLAVSKLEPLRLWAIEIRDHVLYPLAHENSELGRTAEGLGAASVDLLAAGPIQTSKSPAIPKGPKASPG